MNARSLIHRYLAGEATESEIAELDQQLAESPELRKLMLREVGIDTALREVALERASGEATTSDKVIAPRFGPSTWIALAASIAMMAALSWSHLARPKTIATLVSVEDAAWESTLPTTPGSKLTAGQLKLTSGIATIRFTSGAVVQLEAPARLHLETSMRSRLVDGAATVNVPESAIGFIIETPNGYVVDHGTEFSISVDEDTARSSFEVIEGEISVHLPATGEEARLKDKESASIRNETLTTYDEGLPGPPPSARQPSIRITTEGRATSVVRNNFRHAFLDSEMLMVRTTPVPRPQERRSLIAFDVSKADLDSVESAHLWLNLVPSGQGFATRLPKKNTFAFYGITDPSKEAWPDKCLWEEAPTPDDGILLGTINIPRSRQTGRCGIEGSKLLEFLKNDPDGKATILIVRETSENRGAGTGLVHAFASDSHPEASGPILKFKLNE